MNHRPRYSMRQYVKVANVITSGNLTAGFMALLVIMDTRLLAALGLIALAAVFDLVDGPLARRQGTGDSFGTNLDSLADLVSFGAAPALALYVGSLHRLAVAGFAACLVFLLAGAWRLARFPLCKDDRYFVGCPVPVAGVLVGLLAALRTQSALALPLVLVLCILMVSTIRVPTVARLRGLTRIPGRERETRQCRGHVRARGRIRSLNRASGR